LQTSTARSEVKAAPAERGTTQDKSSGRADSYKEEIEALKRSLQEQRRATTLLTAEVRIQTEAREALEAQLIEANASIAASWERRKEMTRVIAARDAKLAEANAEIKANRERRKEISRVVANRDAKIAELYEELGRLQRHIAGRTLSGRAKRLRRSIVRLFR
jgi:chromosome segregation ATPase